jgi:hypothetical protein
MFLNDLKARFIQFQLAPDYHPLPARSRLEMHARYLRVQCGITRTCAKDMVAYYHGYSDWRHLLAGAQQGARPNRMTDIHFLESADEKQKVSEFIKALPAYVLTALKQYVPAPNTLLRAVLEQRPEHLFDAEIATLYYAFFDDEAYEYKTEEIVSSLLARDNSILSHIKRMSYRKLTRTNPHIYNYRTGWKTYCYINLLSNNHVDISVRELDSFIFPSVYLDHFFNTRWCIPYILSHIQQMIAELRHAGYVGTISLYRVNNEGLYEYYRRYGQDGLSRYGYSDAPWIDEKIKALNLALVAAGARLVGGGEQNGLSVYGHLAFDF